MADQLRLQVILDGIDRLSGPLKRITGGAGAVRQSIQTANRALGDFKRTSADISSYQRMRAELRQIGSNLDAARTRVAANVPQLERMRAEQSALAGEVKAARIALASQAREMALANKPSVALAQAYAKQKAELATLETRYNRANNALRNENRQQREAEQTATRLGQRQQDVASKLEGMRLRLERAGVSTAQMAARQRALRTEMGQASRSIDLQRQRLERLNAVQQRARAIHGAGMSATLHGAGFAAAGQGALRASAAPVGAAMRFESAMADVRKVVNFDTPRQFEQMSSDIQDLSTRLPMASQEIAQIVAAAGQANIPRQELLRFAEDAAKMGVAFDTTAEDAGKTMATWRTAFRMTQDQVVTMADKINYLGNTGPANVNQINEVVNRIGALGEVAGLGSGPLAALGATVAGMGIESEVSATGIKNMLLTLSAGDAATKRQRSAFGKLGIDAREMASAMQKDAGGAILGVLDKLKQLPKAEQAATMTTLFGRESIGAIAPLLTNLDLLRTNFGKVSDAQQYGGSMAAEYASRVATSANTLELVKNKAQVLAEVIGKTLLPDFNSLAQRVGAVVSRVVQWVRANPGLVATLAKATIAGAALVTVLGGLLVSGGMAAMAFSQIYKAVGLVANSGALSAISSGLAGVGRLLPLLANGARALLPLLGGISLPVLAVGAAIVVVAALVWKYWGPIKAFMIGMWEGLRAAFAPVLDQMKAALAPLAPAWAAISAAIRPAVDWVKSLFVPFQATSEQLKGATDAGRTFGAVLGTVILAPVNLAITGFRLMRSALASIGEAGGLVLGNLQALWTNISTFFAGLPSKMLQAGIDMMAGFVRGILNMEARVREAITGAVSGAVDKFKQFLGIRSPSRLFAQFGDYTMQGLAVGLDRSGGAPVQAITDVGQRLRQAGAGLALATAAPVMAAPAGGGAPASAAAMPAGPNASHYEIRIYAAPGMDPHAIARAVAAELDRRERQRSASMRSQLTDID